MTMDRLSGDGNGIRLAEEGTPREGTRGMRSEILLQILQDEDEMRYNRIQEARGRIARRFYDQVDVRKEITRALLVLFGHRAL